MSGGVSMGAIFTAIGAAVAGSVVSSMLQKKTQQQQPQQMLVEQPPLPATKDNTKLAAEDAVAQAKKRTAGASGRGDTIKTQQIGALGGVGGDVGEADKSKTLLGY